MATIAQILQDRGIPYSQETPITQLFVPLGINPTEANTMLSARGLSPFMSLGDFFARVPGVSVTSDLTAITSALQGLPVSQDASQRPTPTPVGPSQQVGPNTGQGQVGSPSPVGGTQAQSLQDLAATIGLGPDMLHRIAANPTVQGFLTSQPVAQRFGWSPDTVNAMRSNPEYLLGQTFSPQDLSSFFTDPQVTGFLQNPQTQQSLGFSPGDINTFLGRFSPATTGAPPIGQAPPSQRPPPISPGPPIQVLPTEPNGQFPQVPPIQLPPGLGPAQFQAPPAPTLPTNVTLPPELQSLMQNLQANLTAQQQTRDTLLSKLQEGITQQQANANANQPLLDAALANINSVLTGQAMSPGVAGLVNSAFAPAENEGQVRLRQAAEEAAAARGMHLTDTPIGQPYLDETRRFLEQMGGQRAQAAMGLRQQDATFAQNVRQFQEGLKQQALTNQTEVLRSLGTPEQAASVLSNLGLGARNAAVQQYGIQSQQALGASDQALRAALGQAQINQGNTQQALASQAQGFQQHLAQQQASIQNQLSLMQALGDPYQAFHMGSNTGNSLGQQQLTNLLGLSSGLLGSPPQFGPLGSTQTTSMPNNFGSQLLNMGTTLGAAWLLGGV